MSTSYTEGRAVGLKGELGEALGGQTNTIHVGAAAMRLFRFGWAEAPDEEGLWATSPVARLCLGDLNATGDMTLTFEIDARGPLDLRVVVDGESAANTTVGEEPTAVTVGPVRCGPQTPIDLLTGRPPGRIAERISRRFRVRRITLEPVAQAGPVLLPRQRKVVNFVETTDWRSDIFRHIFSYFDEYLPDGYELAVTRDPLDGADLYVYHRLFAEPIDRIRHPAVSLLHHDPREWYLPNLNYENMLEHLREMDHVIVLNESTRQLLRTKYALSNVTTIHHGYHESLLEVEYPGRIDGKVILGVFSKRYPRGCKGESGLEEMYRRLAPEKFDWLFVGPGRDVDARKCRRLGFEPRWYGHVPYNRLVSLYESISALVMYSHHEGGPACIPEAIGAGCPVVCHPAGLAADLIASEVNGLQLNHDPEHDQRVFERLAREPELLGWLHEGMVARRDRCRTWRQTVEEYCRVWNEELGIQG